MYQAILANLDLSALPPPKVIEEVAFQAIFEELLTQFKALNPTYAYFLASDPAIKVLQAVAYREMIWRETLNHKARARLIAYSSGADLEHMAANWGIERRLIQEANPATSPPTPLLVEDDATLRRRLQARMTSISSAGPAAHYEFHALSADPRVLDVKAYSPDVYNGFNMGGRVHIAVLCQPGTPTPEILEAVTAAVTADTVKMLSDIVSVEPAGEVSTVVAARLVLEQDAPVSTVAAAKAALQLAFADKQHLGWNLSRTWLVRTLAVEGVSEVIIDTPTTSLVVEPNQYPKITAYSIAFAGFVVEEDWTPESIQYTQAMDSANRFFIDYCIRYSLTLEQIHYQLSAADRGGVVKPTLLSVCKYLGVPFIMNGEGVQRPNPELAFFIFQTLKTRYA